MITRRNTIISTTQQLLVVSLLFTIIKSYSVHGDGVVVVLGYQPRFNSILLNKISRQRQHKYKTPLSLSLPFNDNNDKENDDDIRDERSVLTEPANGSSSSSNFGDDSTNNNEVETDLQPGTARDGPSGSSNYSWSYSTTAFELTQAGAVGATTGLLVAVFKLVSSSTLVELGP
jgi:hypothetical protein